ncbi:beta 1-4 rhamnosyltransferase Cps2T [Paenibacillus sp. WC2504]|uniref:beta 1-4 rhamnosyltransferase Cps2T n=1 Tax=Paenibacillus sp. WC2504 TaxID=3461403 RepID=UPI004045E573
MKNIFIIGSKGIPAKYGGFETFVEQLTVRQQNGNIRYHVSCLADNNEEFEHNSARCFNVKTKKIGAATAVLYDVLSIRRCIDYIRQNKLINCTVYILACRIGPFFYFYKRQLEKMGVTVCVNPDGHEWKRSKWNAAIKKYWKVSESLMVKHADLLICDSKGIKSYIQSEYKSYNPTTAFIAYGADIEDSNLLDDSEKLQAWTAQHGIRINEYYLIVGRFVPENNYELMIREFMRSNTRKDLVIITNVEQNQFFQGLSERTQFSTDRRIKFVGTVYDQELLKKIRVLAYGYLHGHEVGGTNPSLLEALASTKLNLLLDVNFNKEVALDGAVYFNKQEDSLASIVNRVDRFSPDVIASLSYKAKQRIEQEYSWSKIVNEYEQLFLTTEVQMRKSSVIKESAKLIKQ